MNGDSAGKLKTMCESIGLDVWDASRRVFKTGRVFPKRRGGFISVKKMHRNRNKKIAKVSFVEIFWSTKIFKPLLPNSGGGSPLHVFSK